jgi:DNA-binding NtrC family response regulator
VSDVTETRQRPGDQAPGSPEPGVVWLYTEHVFTGQRAFRPSGRFRVGRGDVELHLDDSQTSREHFELGIVNGAVAVTDLESRNGTYVNGRREDKTVRAAAGSTIRSGKSLLLVVEDVRRFEPVVEFPPPLVGGAGIAALHDALGTISKLSQPVLLLGETGTGKERVAELLHAMSGRQGPLVAVNMSALPTELVEAELFGHARGSFSGSDRARIGLVRSADRGTLLLDEIGDLPLPLQAKLLRVLESGEVQPLGEDRPTRIDVRFVAATNVDLDASVTRGTFRADLLHRLGVWRVQIPPLRERPEDIPLLVRHFAAHTDPPFSVEAMEQLVTFSHPGNVRELKNAVETAGARARSHSSPLVLREHLPEAVRPRPVSEPVPNSTTNADDAALRVRVDTVLSLRKGNVAQAARDLGVSRPWLYLALERLGIDPGTYRSR